MSLSTSIDIEEKTEQKQDKVVRCKNCNHTITRAAFAIEPHEHTFRNPAGYSFHLLCYSDAPGAGETGQPTTEATWFPGYAWSFAFCQECLNHLGWWFNGSDRFAGLIATRVKR